MKSVNRIQSNSERREEYQRSERLRARIACALRWLDVQAPGRAYTELQEALAPEAKPEPAREPIPFG